MELWFSSHCCRLSCCSYCSSGQGESVILKTLAVKGYIFHTLSVVNVVWLLLMLVWVEGFVGVTNFQNNSQELSFCPFHTGPFSLLWTCPTTEMEENQVLFGEACRLLRAQQPRAPILWAHKALSVCKPGWHCSCRHRPVCAIKLADQAQQQLHGKQQRWQERSQMGGGRCPGEFMGRLSLSLPINWRLRLFMYNLICSPVFHG